MQDQTVGTDISQVENIPLSKLKIQPSIKNLLRVSIDAYFNSRASDSGFASWGPCLLVGPSGTGKTLVAKSIHSALANLNLIETNGELLNTTSELISILLYADNNTTVFVDEAR